MDLRWIIFFSTTFEDEFKYCSEFLVRWGGGTFAGEGQYPFLIRLRGGYQYFAKVPGTQC